MHVIFVPYALMKVNPASWMQMITKFKGTQLYHFLELKVTKSGST